MVHIKSKEMITPGMVAAKNNLPMDCSVMMPYIIRVTLGGMRLPRVPPTAMIPEERLLL
jgi:hypothetical protein